MNRSALRFTLSNITLGSVTIAEPIGIMGNPLTLQRDWNLHCIQETFTGNLTMFYDSALSYLNSAIALGIDTAVSFLAEVSNDYGATWETYYNGLIDMESLQPIDDIREYKIQNVIKRNDLWSAFINRKDTVVDINSATDLDGNATAAPTVTTVALPCQTVDKQSKVSIHQWNDPGRVLQLYDVPVPPPMPAVTTSWVQDLPLDVVNNLQTKYNLGTGTYTYVTADGDPHRNWLMDELEPGLYDFDIDLLFADNAFFPGNPKNYLVNAVGNLHYFHNSVWTQVALAKTNIGTNGVDGCTRFKLITAGLSLVKGDKVAVIIDCTFFGVTYYSVYGGLVIDPSTGISYINSHISIIGHTTAKDSVAQGYLLKDVANAIIKRVTGRDFFSNLLNAGGCMYNYWLGKGIQIRMPSSFGQYPFSQSFSDFFAGLDPITPVGVDTYVDAGVEKISIEDASEFYDPTVSLNLSYVKGIVTSFVKGKATKSVQIGYQKWQLTAGGSLIDDPQTQHTYVPPLRLVGQAISKLSTWVAASLLFELTRRTGKLAPGNTWDLDNDFMVLHLKNDLTGPELSGAATNLLNASQRYNKFLTPGRNFLRWAKFLNLGLVQYVGNVFRFTGGVGNILCGVTLNPGCPGSQVAPLVENADIVIGAPTEFGIKQIDFEAPLNWDQYKIIRNNRRKAIGISETGDSWVPYFVDKIDFYFFLKKAKFTLRATS